MQRWERKEGREDSCKWKNLSQCRQNCVKGCRILWFSNQIVCKIGCGIVLLQGCSESWSSLSKIRSVSIFLLLGFWNETCLLTRPISHFTCPKIFYFLLPLLLISYSCSLSYSQSLLLASSLALCHDMMGSASSHLRLTLLKLLLSSSAIGGALGFFLSFSCLPCALPLLLIMSIFFSGFASLILCNKKLLFNFVYCGSDFDLSSFSLYMG